MNNNLLNLFLSEKLFLKAGNEIFSAEPIIKELFSFFQNKRGKLKEKILIEHPGSPLFDLTVIGILGLTLLLPEEARPTSEEDQTLLLPGEEVLIESGGKKIPYIYKKRIWEAEQFFLVFETKKRKNQVHTGTRKIPDTISGRKILFRKQKNLFGGKTVSALAGDPAQKFRDFLRKNGININFSLPSIGILCGSSKDFEDLLSDFSYCWTSSNEKLEVKFLDLFNLKRGIEDKGKFQIIPNVESLEKKVNAGTLLPKMVFVRELNLLREFSIWAFLVENKQIPLFACLPNQLSNPSNFLSPLFSLDATILRIDKKFLLNNNISLNPPASPPTWLISKLRSEIKHLIKHKMLVKRIESGEFGKLFKELEDLLNSYSWENAFPEEEKLKSVIASILFKARISPINYDEIGKHKWRFLNPNFTWFTDLQEELRALKDSVWLNDFFPALIKKGENFLEFLENNSLPKANYIQQILENPKNKKIILPKNYMVQVINERNPAFRMGEKIATTPSKFNPRVHYSEIYAVAPLYKNPFTKEEQFSIFNCRNCSRTILLAYDFEKLNLDRLKRTGGNTEIYYELNPNQEEELIPDSEYFVEKSKYADIGHFVSQFSSGEEEQIDQAFGFSRLIDNRTVFFTNRFKAYKLSSSGEVKEEDWRNLQVNDRVIFIKNKNAQNLVDQIFEEIILNNPSFKNTSNNYKESLKWRKALRFFQLNSPYNTSKKLAHYLHQLGLSLGNQAIERWIDEEVRIIGPRDESAFLIISNLVKGTEFAFDPIICKKACDDIRLKKIKMLLTIGRALVKVSQRQNENKDTQSKFDRLFEEIIVSKAEALFETVEILDTQLLDPPRSLPSSKLNSPISFEG